MNKQKYASLLSALWVAGSMVACDNSSSTTEDTQVSTAAPVWLWAFDDDNKSVSIYDADKQLAATYTASAFGKMHVMQAGPSEEPTLWMGNGGSIYAFTAGFHNHGDHAHMETPEEYAQLQVGTKSVHMGQSESGDTVAFADDDSLAIYLIDVNTKQRVQTIRNASSHSAALLAGGFAITTSSSGAKEGWLKIVDIAKDSVIDSLTIGLGAHGDAYYAAGQKIYIACATAFYRVDLATHAVDSIAYGVAGRTNFVYHGHGASLALGLHKPAAPDTTSDKFLLLDMAKGSVSAVSIVGAALNWHITKGQFALSRNGQVAIFSDVVAKKVYHVNLTTGKQTTFAVLGAGASVATDYTGSKIWALSGTSVEQIDVASAKIENTFSVATGTDWIYASSIETEVEIDE